MSVYTEAWKTYKARRNYALGAVIVAAALCIFAFFQDHHPNVYPIAFIVAILSMTAASILHREWRSWPCPQCGKAFMANRGASFWEGILLWLGAKRCTYCGLTKSEIIAKSQAEGEDSMRKQKAAQ